MLVLLTVAVTGAWADVIISGNCGTSGHEAEVTYSLTSEGVMTISGTGAMKDFSYQNDQPWQPWKDNRSDITSVVIESGVTTIGNYAFMHCTNLSSLSISNTVTEIGQLSFMYCARLSSVTIPGSVTIIGFQAFAECTDLETFTVEGNSLEIVANNVFQSSKKLTSLSFPSSLKSFGQNFGWCYGMTSLTFNSNPFIGWFSSIGPKNMEVTMNLTANAAGGANWTTFYNRNYSFAADANTEVFKVALSGTELTLNKVANGIVDAGTAVVLKTTGDNPVMTLTTTASGDEQANDLTGVSDAAGVENEGTFYVLNNGSQGVGFYKLKSGMTVGVGKAYLTYTAGAREFFAFDEATGINSATLTNSEKVNNEVYDLQGRRVVNPTKGLYIVNGKKMIKR